MLCDQCAYINCYTIIIAWICNQFYYKSIHINGKTIIYRFPLAICVFLEKFAYLRQIKCWFYSKIYILRKFYISLTLQIKNRQKSALWCVESRIYYTHKLTISCTWNGKVIETVDCEGIWRKLCCISFYRCEFHNKICIFMRNFNIFIISSSLHSSTHCDSVWKCVYFPFVLAHFQL